VSVLASPLTSVGVPVEVADGVYLAVAQVTVRAPAPVTRRTRESAAARSVLRRLLTEIAGPEAGATPIASRQSGQPYLPWRPDLTVSLSHSGDWMAAAVGIGSVVGVDVQVPEPTPERLLRRCCHPLAQEELAGLPAADRDVEFAWIWTAQEACVKATGQGIAGLPWTIPVDVGQRAGSWRGVAWLSPRDRFAVPVSCAYAEVVP
jgi:4'-phosphopantetheinyl transferase